MNRQPVNRISKLVTPSRSDQECVQLTADTIAVEIAELADTDLVDALCIRI